jgi:cytoskeletal protein RodZ
VALDEIARSTKIRVRYLQALEDGQHERLPGIVFAKGYVRAYAETIGADADRLVGAYVAEQRSLGRLETEASQENVLEALAAAVESDRDRMSRRGRLVLIGSVLMLAAFAAFWFGVRPRMIEREPVAVADAARPAPVVTQQEAVPEPLDAATTLQTVEPVNKPVQLVEAGTVTPPAQEVIDTATTEPEQLQPEPVQPEAEPVQPEPEPVQPEPESVQPELEPVQLTPEPVPPALASLSVSEYGVGTDVRQRVLVGEASEFETGTMVVFWNRVMGGEPGRSIRHVWFHEGSVNASRDLPIGAAHWRTYSKQTLRRDGNWAVEVQDENGRVLARETFVASSGKL